MIYIYVYIYILHVCIYGICIDIHHEYTIILLRFSNVFPRSLFLQAAGVSRKRARRHRPDAQSQRGG